MVKKKFKYYENKRGHITVHNKMGGIVMGRGKTSGYLVDGYVNGVPTRRVFKTKESASSFAKKKMR